MEHPRLSICIATFERGKFIAQTLDSILAQWQPGVEIVVVDGASRDDTPQVIEPYLTRQPGVRYHREAENSGVGSVTVALSGCPGRAFAFRVACCDDVPTFHSAISAYAMGRSCRVFTSRLTVAR